MIQNQKFSSNISEFKRNIPYRDASVSSDSYFRLFDVPSRLFLGKNSFRIRINKDYVAPNSLIYIDILDSTGKPIYHEISSYLGEDDSRLVVVNIYENTPPGEATIMIAGRITYNVGTKQSLPYNNDETSFDFKDIPNLLWEKKVLVVPTVQNLEEIVYFAPPNINYKERTEVFNRLPLLNSRYVNFSGSATASISLKSTINPYQYSNSSKFNTSREVDRFVKDVDPEYTGDYLVSKQTQLPKYSELSTIFASGFEFIPSMVGGQLVIRNINDFLLVPSSSVSSIIPDFSCSIIEILDKTTAKIDNGFYAQVDGISYTSILNATNFTASYYTKDVTIQSQYSESFLELQFNQLEPVAGIVDTVKLSYKSFGSFGDFTTIGEFAIKEQNILVDSSSIVPTKLEIIEKPIGQLDDWTEYSTYWNIYKNPNFDLYYNFSQSISFESGVSLIFTASAALSTENGYLVYTNLKNAFRPIVNENTEYKLEISARVHQRPTSSLIDDARISQIDVYISGSSVISDIVHQPNIMAPIKSDSFGSYIGSITNNTGNTQLNSKLYFKTLSTANITPTFVVRSGQFWEIKDIKLIPRNESGYSPNQAKLQVPLNTFKTNTELILKAEYLNSAGRKSEYETRLIGVNFTGSGINQILRESNIISGSEQVRDILQGDGATYITLRDQHGDPSPLPGTVQIYNSGSVIYYQDETGSKYPLGGPASGSGGTDWSASGSGGTDWSAMTNKPAGLVSGSSQLASEISGAFTLVSASLSSDKLNKIGSGVYSSSTQLPSGIISSSTQLPANLLSSSVQIASDISGAFTLVSASLASEKLNKIGSNVYSSSTQLPSGIISSSAGFLSSSAQIASQISGAFTSVSSSLASEKLNKVGSNVYSSSNQLPSGLISSSAGLLSSSAQISSDISGAFTLVSSSLASEKLNKVGSNVYSSSNQLPSGIISSSVGFLSSSAQISTDISGAFNSISSSLASEKLNKVGSNVYSSSNQLPSGIISSSTQISTEISGAFTTISSSLASEKLNKVGSNVYSSSAQVNSVLEDSGVTYITLREYHGDLAPLAGSVQIYNSGSVMYYQDATGSKFQMGGVASGSGVDWLVITNKPAGLLSGSNGFLSSSAQIASEISGAFTLVSSSLASGKLNRIGDNVYTSSAQLPSGIISSSTQVNSILQDPGVQYTTYINQSADPTPIPNTLQIFSSGSSLYYQDGTGSNFQIGGPASGSGTDWSVITNKPSGLISSSAQLPSGLISASAQISTEISGAFTLVSSSLASEKLNKVGSGVYSSSNQLPSGIISSSTQIATDISGAFTSVSSSLASEKLNKVGSGVYSSSTQLPSGLISSSAQLPANLLSSSAQISTDISGAFTSVSSSLASEKLNKVGSGVYSSSAQLPSGIISGSSQIASEISGAFTSISSSLASEKLDKVGSGVYSSSTQLPSGIISGSSQLPSGLFSSSAQLPSGIISSSAQISTDISGAFTTVSASLASEKLNKIGSGVYSSSTQLPSGIISSSTQLPSGLISSSTQLPSGIISSSTQLPSGIISGAAQLLPRVSSSATNATPIPNVDTTDIYTLTALASAATFGAPTGTANNGEKLIIRIKDNGGAQTIGWNAAYSAAGIPLPVSTTASKTMHCGFMYNADNALNKWELIAFLTA